MRLQGNLWPWLPFQGLGLEGEWLRHYFSRKHENWVHAPLSKPLLVGSMQPFVGKEAAPEVPPDARLECPIPRMRSMCLLNLTSTPLHDVVTCVMGIHNGH